MCSGLNCDPILVKAIPGVSKITEGYNPATWMLEVSNVEEEMQLGVDFADIYLKSSLYQYEISNFSFCLNTELSIFIL